MPGPRLTPWFRHINECAVCNGFGDRIAIFDHALQMNLDGFLETLANLGLRLARGDTSWQLGHIGAVAGRGPLEYVSVAHSSQP